MNKQAIVRYIENIFADKIKNLKETIEQVQQSANQESKSSVGDKYETARAMAQNEVFMLNTQLNALQSEFNDFKNTKFDTSESIISKGSLIKTNKGVFLIAASLGKVVFEKNIIFCISSEAPIALQLLKKEINSSISINGNTIKILEIF